MPALLVALNDGPGVLVDKPILLLGRHPECDVQIDSRKISRRHCCIAQVHDYLVVRDLDSTNGILINGVRVIEGKLVAGDELTIGSHRYQVSWDDGPPQAPLQVAKAKPAPQASRFDDAMLESCEEPVALPDSGWSRPRPPASPVAAPPMRGTDPASPVLPDNLRLLPGSGSFSGLHGPRPQGT